jgi:hypothetical protein
MDGTASHRVTGDRRWRPGGWILAAIGVFFAVGALIQACGKQDVSGPRNANVTGFSNTALDIVIRVSANPASIEAGRRVAITVSVTNANGQPLAGKRVLVNTSTNTAAFGTVDAPQGVTDSHGLYTTTMIVRCADVGNVLTTGGGGGGTTAAPTTTAGTTTAGTTTGGSASTTGGTGGGVIVTVDAFVDGQSSAVSGNSATVTITGSGNNPPCPGSA